jgi:hypothetical protein
MVPAYRMPTALLMTNRSPGSRPARPFCRESGLFDKLLSRSVPRKAFSRAPVLPFNQHSGRRLFVYAKLMSHDGGIQLLDGSSSAYSWTSRRARVTTPSSVTHDQKHECGLLRQRTSLTVTDPSHELDGLEVSLRLEKSLSRGVCPYRTRLRCFRETEVKTACTT